MRRKTAVVLAFSLVAALLIVALAVASCGGSTTTTVGASTTVSPATTGAINAAALFAQDCQGCHGSIPSAGLDVVKATIQNGRGSMPGFADKLTADQVSALANYVASGGK